MTEDAGNRDADSASQGSTDSTGAHGATFSADEVRLALRRVRDPEINLNIVDLGLIYDIRVEDRDIRVDMSLTSPGCPSGPEIMGEAEEQLRSLDGVGEVVINLVWSPPWSPERIDSRVRAYLGM